MILSTPPDDGKWTELHHANIASAKFSAWLCTLYKVIKNIEPVLWPFQVNSEKFRWDIMSC